MLYIIVEDAGDEPEVVRLSGLTVEQLVSGIMVRASYRLSSDRGCFRGSVINDVQPLCDGERWDERAEPGIRTWCREDEWFFRFFPCTLGDLYTVTRFGRPAIYLDRFDGVFAAMSQGGDGVQIRYATQVYGLLLELLHATGLPVVEDAQDIAGWVDANGNLAY
jgi:hypothetical protein